MRFLLIALFVGTTLAINEEHHTRKLFDEFKREHNKVYNTREEHSDRFKIFSQNVEKINKHNAEGHSYKQGINQFSDMTDEEFEAYYLGGYKPMAPQTKTVAKGPRMTMKELPESVDWREKGVVTPVKNQGRCGSCWAFATTQIIESYAAIATGNLIELSTQQVTSCAPNNLNCGGTGGCFGSIPQLGFTYINLFGHATEADYPYVSGQTMQSEECKYDVLDTKPVVGLTGYDTWHNDQEAVMNHLATVGPLSVAAYASLWKSYTSGVYTGCSFSENIDLNHAVMLVGYGTDPEEGDYWIVRNSWGPNWGEGGYIRLQRQAIPECGVDYTPMDGTSCAGGPGNDELRVCGQCGVLYEVTYPLGAHAL